MASHPNPGSSGTKQDFSIRVPKNSKKKFHVMRFNSNLGVDFTKWKSQNMQIKMERENNLKEFKGLEEDLPKFGAGSEFGREQREEARRKKYGYVAKKYKPDDQPWILKQGGKSGKKFKGIREGGVSDNTAYYVFTQAGNNIIEAHPLQEWYKFQPIQRYKALSAEEAEAEFGRRNKIINYFSLMTKKRLRNEEDGDLDDPDEVKGKKGGSKKKDKGDLKISEMDDWVDSDEYSDSDEDGKKSDDDDDEGRGRGKNKKKNNKKGAPKKKKKDSDDEAIEESDDGDEEGRELDYISDSSESASDHEMKANKELKGVAEEDALRKLLNSESEDEEENEEKKDEEASNSEDEESKNKKEKEEKEGNDKTKESSKKKKPSKKDKKSNNKNNKNANKKNDGESSSELSPNSTDSDSDSYSKNKSANKTKDATNSADSSRSATPTPGPSVGEKRKLTQSELAVAATKKAKLDSSSSGASSSHLINNCESGITEDAVRRYLMRKPMTTTELLQKFKSKKSGLSSAQMVNILTQILKNINPHIQNIQNKKYLSIKSTDNKM